MASEPIFKQVETVQLAPDALVFINGSDTVKDEHGEVYQIRNDISDLSADLDIASQGTASFTIVMPDHSIRRFADRRYNALRLMSEIEIYFKGRFPKCEAVQVVGSDFESRVTTSGIKIVPAIRFLAGLI